MLCAFQREIKCVRALLVLGASNNKFHRFHAYVYPYLALAIAGDISIFVDGDCNVITPLVAFSGESK